MKLLLLDNTLTGEICGIKEWICWSIFDLCLLERTQYKNLAKSLAHTPKNDTPNLIPKWSWNQPWNQRIQFGWLPTATATKFYLLNIVEFCPKWTFYQKAASLPKRTKSWHLVIPTEVVWTGLHRFICKYLKSVLVFKFNVGIGFIKICSWSCGKHFKLLPIVTKLA